ncbi:MAG: PhnD/SsuA/transferrin family substrate-binding protein [Methylomonas sp.]|uniref:PhnD/SsuA/transferrin family substrate-binding protein n=1 Tax=Methylomonas sp. TaxID=418 RepID=UPI0025D7FB6D|nr:PhnD/SsuA/transferrin family substrate-binding protein [Methylomonas sp.]MCK9605683.1 PhnD/SsuA/transferrin family substrate-binding protein [Methylomonas sp.]
MGLYTKSITEQASISDIEISMNFWVKDALAFEAQKAGIDIQTTGAFLYETMQDMRVDFDHGKLDIIVAPPLLISRYFKRDEITDGFSGMLEDNKPDNLLLIVRADSNIQNIQDLRGKRIAMLEGDELAEMYMDTLFLRAFKKGYKTLAASIQQQAKANRIVLDLYFNKADAGLAYVNSFQVMSELNPDIRNKVKVLDTFEVRSKNYSYMRKNYPLANEIRQIALSFYKSARGKQILDIYKTAALDFLKVEELDTVDKLDREHAHLAKGIK